MDLSRISSQITNDKTISFFEGYLMLPDFSKIGLSPLLKSFCIIVLQYFFIEIRTFKLNKVFLNTLYSVTFGEVYGVEY
ncbi:hypothetical protein NIES4101_81180 [Calothrix sp. NIES-4101]|nr:hypothetical protein NIES4101_81180 [Calothrix sp. NIES-4101]